MRRPSTKERPPRGSMAYLCRLETVTVPVMVYVAIQVSKLYRFLSLEEWRGERPDLPWVPSQHGPARTERLTMRTLPRCYSRYSSRTMNGPKTQFAGGTCKWSSQVGIWLISILRELFGDENGLTSVASTHRSTSNSHAFLAKAKAQATKRRIEKTVANDLGKYLSIL